MYTLFYPFSLFSFLEEEIPNMLPYPPMQPTKHQKVRKKAKKTLRPLLKKKKKENEAGMENYPSTTFIPLISQTVPEKRYLLA